MPIDLFIYSHDVILNPSRINMTKRCMLFWPNTNLYNLWYEILIKCCSALYPNFDLLWQNNTQTSFIPPFFMSAGFLLNILNRQYTRFKFFLKSYICGCWWSYRLAHVVTGIQNICHAFTCAFDSLALDFLGRKIQIWSKYFQKVSERNVTWYIPTPDIRSLSFDLSD